MEDEVRTAWLRAHEVVFKDLPRLASRTSVCITFLMSSLFIDVSNHSQASQSGTRTVK
jgi:hypothetical protein